MTTYGFDKDKVVEVGGGALGSLFRGVGMLVLLGILVILMFAAIARVPAGHVGVLTLFGRVTGEVLPEGIHWVNPFKVNNLMSVRTQEIKESATVPSSEGLVISLDTSLIYHLRADRAAEVYQKIGNDYSSVVIEPTLRAAIREATASHSANALYTGEREKVGQEIYNALERELGKRGIEVENIFLRDVQLPQALKASIEAKQQAEQESLAMSFKLQKERQEADRKRIEAEGIRDFQHTVSQGISPELLTWKGIEATEHLADSKNSKIVIIGNTKNGLPLVLTPQ
ncbi:MAG TPA: prohibitin family protein [Terriglobales bacterium]|nr:prohibitin family protein [Terriglobales bacterium]